MVMKNKASKFIIGFVLLVFFLDYTTSKALNLLYCYNENGQSGGKVNHYVRLDPRPDISILGNSRAMHHLIPDSLSASAYSLTHNGLSFIFHAGLFDLVSSSAESGDTVVFHLEPDELYDRVSFYQDIRFLKYHYNRSDVIREYTSDLSPYEGIKHWLSLYNFNSISLNVVKGAIDTYLNGPSSKGFTLLEANLSSVENVRVGAEDQTRYATDSTISANPQTLQLLDHLIKVANEQDIKLVFFTSPVYYRPTLRQIDGCEILEEHLKRRGVFYLDFMTKIEIQELSNEKMWYDASHLNSNGARVFSSQFRKELDKLRIQ